MGLVKLYELLENEAETIDAWVMKRETWLNGWKRKILFDYKEEITGMFMKL